VKEVRSPPGLLGLYAKALSPGARRRETLPDTTYSLAGQTIDAHHLVRYQRVCGFRVSHILPPTYLHVLAFPMSVALMSDRSFPVPLVGLVHVQNMITVIRPVDADERPAFTVRVADLLPHRNGRQFDVLLEARVSDELVWSGRSTYLHREPTEQRTATPTRAVPEPSAGPVTQLRVPADTGRRYAAVSGDRNPIHLWAPTARLFGFPRAIAHGMWVKARRTRGAPTGGVLGRRRVQGAGVAAIDRARRDAACRRRVDHGRPRPAIRHATSSRRDPAALIPKWAPRLYRRLGSIDAVTGAHRTR
jgi:MaoC like domain